MSESVVLMLLALLVLSGLVMVGSVFAQSIPKPSVPEFTLRLVAHPYDVAPVYEIDPYSGDEVLTAEGYHVENKSIEITIKNQPFTPYTHEDGYEINLYYNVRCKGHFGDDSDWKELYSRYKDPSSGNPVKSSSEYTVLSLSADYPDDSQVDFQVEAIVGHYYDELAGRPVLPLYVLLVDETSGWSSTQTLTIGEVFTPADQGLILGVAVTVVVIIAGLGLLVYRIKRK